MDKLYMKGELLQLHTDCEVVEGRFYSMNNDKSKISLYDVKELSQSDKNEGIFHYYSSEVCNIVKIKEADEQKHLKISQKECEDMIKVSKKYIFINQVDFSFHKALDDLKQYSYIGLSTDGATMGRKCKMPFMVLSTPHNIYIFDIQVMQNHAFDAGLKALLESEVPKKIIHDCRTISDCLHHKHNVKLMSVFDTQVGDVIIMKNKKGCLSKTVRNLSECLNYYLGLPMNIIEDKLDLLQCNERPLTTKIKETLAKNITYLHRLSEMINEEMMLPFVRGVECYLDNMRSTSDLKAWQLCGNPKALPNVFKSSIEY